MAESNRELQGILASPNLPWVHMPTTSFPSTESGLTSVSAAGELAGQKHTVTKDEVLEINSLSLNIPEGIPVSPEWISIINPILGLGIPLH